MLLRVLQSLELTGETMWRGCPHRSLGDLCSAVHEEGLTVMQMDTMHPPLLRTH